MEQVQALGQRDNAGRVDRPVGVSHFPNAFSRAPRDWTAEVYPSLFYWSDTPRGGHFAALEVPDLFVAEMRACFRALR